ncbi:hypothetical protein [Methanobrevibacter boviskoreani]|nr:hypothetical protein [Methanobrevibacter boviskoreani]AGN16328.1 hypothetical protein Abm4_0421 [Methanobrevibacter sp. AbM4]MCI6775073.1 hypothetical protein [Methanobrevibacter boviskoreani]MDD6256545.1 hypothetical protein [Methanobrevibacter boviskoreani]MDY5614477.1 hypothetical protein [Methanobrevibacter boviskoreani]
MMRPLTIHAKNKEELDKFTDLLEENNFKLHSYDDNFSFLYKRAYGNWVAHLICIILAATLTAWFLFGNLVLFLYAFYRNSQYVLITTKLENDGEKLDFDEFNEIDLDRGSFS